jgi:putative ABC transport system substrate-binding protein
VSILPYATATKRWELLHDLVPSASPIAYLAKPDSLSSQLELKALQPIWASLAQQVNILNVSNEREIDTAFTRLVELRSGALFIPAEALLTARRDQIVTLAARHSVPAIYPFREFVAAGGLMSYGASLATSYRLTGVYAGRILKGEKPADLPVLQPTRFEFVINLKTAKMLGLDIPLKLHAFADEVIE